MVNNNGRYEGYYLVQDTDTEMEEVGFDEVPKKFFSRRFWILFVTIVICILIFSFVLIFIAAPLAFMNSIQLQQILLFTHFGLPKDEAYFAHYRFPSYENRYIEMPDVKDKRNISLGMWHILPEKLAFEAIHNPTFNYEQSLMNSNYSVLIYFHGTGESRADSSRKYQLLTSFFHIITFDYRSYADSSEGFLSEQEIINDCLNLYHWVKNRTNSPIYFWGHSFGAAIAAHTASALVQSKQAPRALVLESAFTNLKAELYVHPYSRIFAWLPWFEATVVNPLLNNGFIFDTASELSQINFPVMILHSEDDDIIPVSFGRELYKIAYERNSGSVIYHEFKDAGHIFIYQDPFLKYYLMNFINLVQTSQKNNTSILTKTAKINEDIEKSFENM